MERKIGGKIVQKILVWLMSVMVLFLLVFSAFYLAAEADHDCAEEDCPICDCLIWCANYLNRVSDGTVPLIVSLMAIAYGLMVWKELAEGAAMPTLVVWKVRLNP